MKPTDGSWDSTVIGNPSVIVYNGTTYCAYDGQSTFDWAYGKVGLATSVDNIHWNKASTYLFDPAYVPGDRAESAPQIVRVGNQYNCYYCAYIGRGTYPGDYYELAFAVASLPTPTSEPTPSYTPFVTITPTETIFTHPIPTATLSPILNPTASPTSTEPTKTSTSIPKPSGFLGTNIPAEFGYAIAAVLIIIVVGLSLFYYRKRHFLRS